MASLKYEVEDEEDEEKEKNKKEEEKVCCVVLASNERRDDHKSHNGLDWHHKVDPFMTNTQRVRPCKIL